MSLVSTAHNLEVFDSKNSKPFTGQRLARITYKTQKDGTKPRESVCASIPVLSVSAETMPNALFPHVNAWLQDVQDKVIRARYEDGATSISDTDISVASCIAFLDADAKGDRLTKEYLIAWYASDLADTLYVAIADKLQVGAAPNDSDIRRIEQMSNAYRDSIASLAGGKTSYTPDKAQKLAKAVALASDGEVKDKLLARLEKMQVVVELDDLGL